MKHIGPFVNKAQLCSSSHCSQERGEVSCEHLAQRRAWPWHLCYSCLLLLLINSGPCSVLWWHCWQLTAICGSLVGLVLKTLKHHGFDIHTMILLSNNSHPWTFPTELNKGNSTCKSTYTHGHHARALSYAHSCAKKATEGKIMALASLF